MRKFILSFSFFISFCFGAEFEQIKTNVAQISENLVQIYDSPNLIIGSSGVILKQDKNNQIYIAAKVILKEKNGEFANLEVLPFKELGQDAFPSLNLPIEKGDVVLMNYLYNRSLIVAPTLEAFRVSSERFEDIDFVHPDLVAAYLSRHFSPEPSKKDFQKNCATNATGLIYFVLDKQAVFVDCNSFKVLKSFESSEINEFQAPFYSNVKEVKELLFDFFNSEIKNYDKYYKKLLGLQ